MYIYNYIHIAIYIYIYIYTKYQHLCMYAQLKCMGGHFFLAHLYIQAEYYHTP